MPNAAENIGLNEISRYNLCIDSLCASSSSKCVLCTADSTTIRDHGDDVRLCL